MAYYAAVISVQHTIERLLDSSQISILPPSREILEDACKEVRSFQEFLQKNEEMMIKHNGNERVKSLNGEITEAAYKLEDALESHISNQYEISDVGDHEQELFLDLEEVKKEINLFIETMQKIEKMMMDELSKPLPEEEDDVVPSKSDFGGSNSKMIGLSVEFSEIKDKLMNELSSKRVIHSVFGMAGIGKTTFVLKIFEDPSISSLYNPRVFVTIGPEYRLKNVMLSILVQMNHNIDEIRMEEDEKLDEYIRGSLQGRRYLIVFDDVWKIADLLRLRKLLPKESNMSLELVTTRQENVARFCTPEGNIHRMRFLSEEESWDLLREKVFGEGCLCPFRLEKFGKKIAKNCEGLPLGIITVANILSKREKTLEYWKKVADKKHSVYTDAYDQMSCVLISSYNYLPQYLKPCFLYMGVFPQSCKISSSKLVKLWSAEGFLEPNQYKHFQYFARVCLKELVSRSLVLVNHFSSEFESKTCILHSAYWHLCVKEAGKEKFLHVFNHYASSFTEGITNQRRLSIHNNVLFGIKEVHNSMETILMARSLLCTGSHHQYPVPMCFGLRLLRVLDALTIRFYKFPVEVLKLVRLKYLALTYSGKIPGSISKLWNLEHLIIHRYLSINKFSSDSSYLPVEIWNMKELRQIQVTGGNLPDPCGAFLPNLLTLSDMSMDICSKKILERTPNLKKLGIQIELSPDAIEPLCCFDHLSHLYYLESLKCVIANPKPMSQVVTSFTTLPSNLTKLSLSGLGYTWEYMRTIAKLRKLKVLKLRCYAFQGPVWESHFGEFLQLKYLLLEDIDLVHWRADSIYCFPFLRCLIVRHCYKLKEIPSSLGCDGRPELMELVDCHSFGASVEQLKKQYRFSKINIQSSLNDEK